MPTLRAVQIDNLKRSIEENLDSIPCDHSLRLTKAWAYMNEFDFDDLIDILELNGCFCDCEVIFNLPDNKDLSLDNSMVLTDSNNPWKLPSDYKIKHQINCLPM